MALLFLCCLYGCVVRLIVEPGEKTREEEARLQRCTSRPPFEKVTIANLIALREYLMVFCDNDTDNSASCKVSF